jgi:hypothetical protein
MNVLKSLGKESGNLSMKPSNISILIWKRESVDSKISNLQDRPTLHLMRTKAPGFPMQRYPEINYRNKLAEMLSIFWSQQEYYVSVSK